jgi:hypothetical protein
MLAAKYINNKVVIRHNCIKLKVVFNTFTDTSSKQQIKHVLGWELVERYNRGMCWCAKGCRFRAPALAVSRHFSGKNCFGMSDGNNNVLEHCSYKLLV